MTDQTVPLSALSNLQPISEREVPRTVLAIYYADNHQKQMRIERILFGNRPRYGKSVFLYIDQIEFWRGNIGNFRIILGKSPDGSFRLLGMDDSGTDFPKEPV